VTTWTGPDHDHDPQEPRADEHQPRTYVTEISYPPPADTAVQRLHSSMKEPGPEPEAGS
jgi:hypothetical protein